MLVAAVVAAIASPALGEPPGTGPAAEGCAPGLVSEPVSGYGAAFRIDCDGDSLVGRTGATAGTPALAGTLGGATVTGTNAWVSGIPAAGSGGLGRTGVVVNGGWGYFCVLDRTICPHDVWIPYFTSLGVWAIGDYTCVISWMGLC